jgi:hypothetical protein
MALPVFAQCDPSAQAAFGPADGASGDRFGFAVAISGNTALVGAQVDDNENGTDAGAAYIFDRQAAGWSQTVKLLPADGGLGDYFADTADLDSDTFIVGSPFHDVLGFADAGAAYIYHRSNGTWTLQSKLTASDPRGGDHFGIGVAISGNAAAVGNPLDDITGVGSDVGSVYIYNRDGNDWTITAHMVTLDRQSGDLVGSALAMDGDTIVAGAYGDDDGGLNRGSAYVFVRSNGLWSQQAKLVPSDGDSGDHFAYGVAISGDVIVVGAPDRNRANLASVGAAYVYTRQGNTWTEAAILTASDGAAGDEFGLWVSIDQDVIAVGSPSDDNTNGSNAGAIYLFRRQGPTWTQFAKLIAEDGQASDQFGYASDMQGDTLLVGALEANVGAINAGAVYEIDLGCDLDNDGVLDADDDCDDTPYTVPAAYVTTSGTIVADLDSNCIVDGWDYALLLAAFGHCAPDEQYIAAADLDGDGCITFIDTQIWIDAYRSSRGSPTLSPPTQASGDVDSDGTFSTMELSNLARLSQIGIISAAAIALAWSRPPLLLRKGL